MPGNMTSQKLIGHIPRNTTVMIIYLHKIFNGHKFASLYAIKNDVSNIKKSYTNKYYCHNICFFTRHKNMTSRKL